MSQQVDIISANFIEKEIISVNFNSIDILNYLEKQISSSDNSIIVGLSTDEKPISGIEVGTIFLETDTGTIYHKLDPSSPYYYTYGDWRPITDSTALHEILYDDNSDKIVNKSHNIDDGVFDKNWTCIGSDSTGQYLIACYNQTVGNSDNGRIYTSTNFGVTWIERQPAGNVERGWFSVASDSTGAKLIVAESNGRIYTSDDFGVTWTERQPDGAVDNYWHVASDSTGTKLIAIASQRRIWTSIDSGANWTERQPKGDVNSSWYSVCSDSTGVYLMVSSFGVNGQIFKSSDSGVNWTECKPLVEETKDWLYVSCNSTGQYRMVGFSTKSYRSDDYGITWNEILFPLDLYQQISSKPVFDITGQYILIASDKKLLQSDDYGINWYITENANFAGNIQSITSDNTGNLLACCARWGRVYLSSDNGNTWTERFNEGHLISAIEVIDTVEKKHDIQTADTIPTEETGVSVQDALNLLDTSRPTISIGTNFPSTTPTKVGDIYVDTNAKKLYFAVGISSSADWIIAN